MHEIGEFKGSATITLKSKPEDRYGLTFGVVKAKLILAHIDAIKKFIQDHDTTKDA